MASKKKWNGAGSGQQQGPQQQQQPQQAKPAPPPSAPVKRDAQERPIPSPLQDVDVSVDSKARPSKNTDEGHNNTAHSIKIDGAMSKEIRKAVEKAADGGHPKQFDAARKTAERIVKENVDPATVHEVKVKVSGTVDGEKKEEKFTVPLPERKHPDAPKEASAQPKK